jgi:excisionase family DNA binding protein
MEQTITAQMGAAPGVDLAQHFLSIKEVAAATGRCYKTIHTAIKNGRIRTVRFGGAVMIPAIELRRIFEEGF